MKKLPSIVGIVISLAVAGFAAIPTAQAYGFLRNPLCLYRDTRGQCLQYSYRTTAFPERSMGSFFGSPLPPTFPFNRLINAYSVIQSPWDNRYSDKLIPYDTNYNTEVKEVPTDGLTDNDDSFYDDDDQNYYDDDDGYDTSYDDDDYFYYDDDDEYRDDHSRDPSVEDDLRNYCLGYDCSRPYFWY